MSRKDLVFLVAFLGLVCLLAGEALFLPGRLLGNFGDIYAYHYPLRHLAASTLQEGRLPLWNPWIFAGTPLLANPQAALFSPLSAAYQLLPLGAAFDLSAAAHLVLAYLGAALLCRRWRLSAAGAFALAASYALGSFVLYRIPQGVPTLLAALAWVPWTWLAAEAGGAALFAAAVGLQLLSGHPQFMAINLAGMALYLACVRPSRLRLMLTGGALAAAATAAQWVPTLEFLGRSVRAHWTSLYASAYSLEAKYLGTLLWPDAMGNPLNAGFRGYPSEFFEMAGLYSGLVPVALAALGLWRLRRSQAAAGILALAAAGLFLALGVNNPLFRPWLETPGFGSLRVPARYALLMVWALWMAAAAGWKGLPHMRAGWRLAAALAAFVALDLGFWQSRFLYAQTAADFLKPGAALEVLRRLPDQRFATSPEIPNPNKGMLYRLPNVTGYEAFYLAGAALYASRAQGVPSADGSRTYIRDFKAPALAALGLRWYVTSDRPPGLVPVFDGGEVRVYENPAAGPLARADGGGAVRLIRTDPESWEMEVPAGTRAVVAAQADYPGWKAWAGNAPAPLETTAGFLQRVRLPEELREPRLVHLRFDPLLWKAAFLATTLALLAALTLICLRPNSFTS